MRTLAKSKMVATWLNKYKRQQLHEVEKSRAFKSDKEVQIVALLSSCVTLGMLNFLCLISFFYEMVKPYSVL
jgi:hypothetical protein